MQVDLLNLLATLWLKPLLVFALLFSIARVSFTFSAAANHAFLLAALWAFCLCLPLSLVPPIALPLLPSAFAAALAWPLALHSPWLLVVTGIYVLGVFWGAFYLLAALWDIARLSARALPCDDANILAAWEKMSGMMGLNKPVDIKISPLLISPLVWGWLRPCILLPVDARHWDAARLLRVLGHEAAHIARRDWPLKMACQCLCLLCWPIPPLWLVVNRMQWYAELACDDRVIALLQCRADYAQDLLTLSRATHQPAALGFIKRSTLFQRIDYVLDGRNQREPTTRVQHAVYFVICAVLMLPPISIGFALAPVVVDFAEPPVAVTEKAHAQSQSATVFDIEKPDASHQRVIQVLPQQMPRMEEVAITYRPQKPNPADVQVDLVLDLPASMPSVSISGVVPQVFVTPEYPERALRRGIEGEVVAVFDVNVRGEIENIRIDQTSKPRVFDRAVVAALKKSRFSPMKIDGMPVITKNVSETYTFRIVESTP